MKYCLVLDEQKNHLVGHYRQGNFVVHSYCQDEKEAALKIKVLQNQWDQTLESYRGNHENTNIN